MLRLTPPRPCAGSRLAAYQTALTSTRQASSSRMRQLASGSPARGATASSPSWEHDGGSHRLRSSQLPFSRAPALLSCHSVGFLPSRALSSSSKSPPSSPSLPPKSPSSPPASPSTPSSPSNPPRLTLSELSSLQRRAQQAHYSRRNRSLAYYSLATIIFGLGITYAAVPLYRAFCSATGFAGTPMVGIDRFEPSRLVPSNLTAQRIRVTFNTDCSDELPWSFKPSQEEIFVIPGETALAFFTAKSRSKKDIIGIATYNVAPDRIAPHFSKVECFCFEEQKLLAGEEVDLPVFFFIDNDFLDDPNVRDVKDVVLSYTFFAARRNKTTGQLEPDTDLENYSVGMDLPGVK